ncbi:MAG TPA: hypothetical protein PLP83_09450 [Candidatus Aminicenantes bacterium]|nr:hypothetical protein [Candidatus Aminicenantes bacterium]
MKRALGFLILAVLFVTAACVRYVPYGESGRYPGGSPYDRERGRDYDRYGSYDTAYFYDQLEPYGLWVAFRPYGYVWVPRHVGYNWRPYTQGRWAWTDYGWTWVSVERWGWIAFHYGRWGWDRRLGWYWVPDTLWEPAWVAWRWGDEHIGWAPLPPGAGFVPGRGFGRRQWDIPYSHWSFVSGRYFLDGGLDRRILPVERNPTIINMTVLNVNIDTRDRRVYNEGVDIDRVRRLTDRTVVDRLSLRDSNRPGEAREQGRELVVFKPEIAKSDTARPRRVVDESKAARQLQTEETGRVFRRVPRSESEALREDHDQELRLMRESQATDLRVVRREAEDEKAKVQNPEEKRRVEDRTATRVAELQKKHEQEKAELEKRQKAEEEKARVKKAPLKRKIEPDR